MCERRSAAGKKDFDSLYRADELAGTRGREQGQLGHRDSDRSSILDLRLEIAKAFMQPPRVFSMET